MRIRQIRGNGYPCWPPVWVEKFLNNNDEGVLNRVALVSGTTILKLEVGHGEENVVGLLMFEKELLDPVYQMLRANIGRTLAEVGELEINY